MSGKPENACVFPYCWSNGTLRGGSARELILCDQHASIADLSDERLQRWLRVAGRIYQRFDLVNTLAKDEVRRFRVALHNVPEPVLVRAANVGSVSIFTWRPFIDVWIGQRPFGIVTSVIDPDGRPLPEMRTPMLMGEWPGIFNAIEDGDFEEVSEALLLLGHEL